MSHSAHINRWATVESSEATSEQNTLSVTKQQPQQTCFCMCIVVICVFSLIRSSPLSFSFHWIWLSRPKTDRMPLFYFLCVLLFISSFQSLFLFVCCYLVRSFGICHTFCKFVFFVCSPISMSRFNSSRSVRWARHTDRPTTK